MARNNLTQWLHDQSPEYFVVFEKKRWLMAPANKVPNHEPELLMDLREIDAPISNARLDTAERNLQVARRLAEMGGLPLIVILYPANSPVTDATQLMLFEIAGRDETQWQKGKLVTGRDLRTRFFPGSGGAGKEVNVEVASEFHRWQRESLPDTYVFHDLDVVLVDSGKNSVPEPRAVIEHKQSFDTPETWNKKDYMKRDAVNYLAQKRLCERTDTLPYAIYHCKNVRVDDDTAVGVFRIQNVTGTQVNRKETYTCVGDFRKNPSKYIV